MIRAFAIHCERPSPVAPTPLERDFASVPPAFFKTEIDEKIALLSGGTSSYGLHLWRGTKSGNIVPVVLDDFVPADQICRVIDAFVEKLVMSELGFERAQTAETGRPGYDPRDLLKLYLYGYLNQIRSSRRLEAECRRSEELLRPAEYSCGRYQMIK